MNSSLSHAARLIFAGGGTGGHLYPAIAIADRVSQLLEGKRPVEILFVGTRRGIEYRIRKSIGYPLHLIDVRGLARRLTLDNLLVPYAYIKSLFQVSRLLNRFRPDVVVGTGGYVAMPVLKTAAVKKIPTFLQEQNSFPGITTRRLAHSARRVYLGFEGAKKHLPKDVETVVTGNPVRASIAEGNRVEAIRSFDLDPDRRTILVMGGSQGARSINNAVSKALTAGSLRSDCQLLWQTGKRDYKEVIESLGDRANSHALFPFAENMANVYAAADLAIARAGAISLAELEMVRLPSILIPYPHAAGDHQRFNAADFARQGFAEVVDEVQLDGVDLLARAGDILESNEAEKMRNSMKQATVGRKPAADVIAEDIISVIEAKNQDGGNR